MRKERKHYTAEEKAAILRRHLLDRVPVSDLCEELGLQPTVFNRWQKELFENGAAAFQAQERPHRQVEEKQKRIEFLEKKVQTKDEVLVLRPLDYVTKLVPGLLAGKLPLDGNPVAIHMTIPGPSLLAQASDVYDSTFP